MAIATDTLYILVDYDNLDERIRRPGLSSLARFLYSQINEEQESSFSKIKIRLYGGWFTSGGKRTRKAQELLSEISKYFGFAQSMQRTTESKKIWTTVELANGPIDDDRIHFHDTLVERPVNKKYKFYLGQRNRCSNTPCYMEVWEQMTELDRCPLGTCGVNLSQALYCLEQKMVDSMIITDLTTLAYESIQRNVIILSDDADLLPGVYLALRKGCRILRIGNQTNIPSGMRTAINSLTSPELLTFARY